MTNSRLLWSLIFRTGGIYLIFAGISIGAFISHDQQRFLRSLDRQIESELTYAAEIIRDNYTVGDLVSLRAHLNALSESKGWRSGFFNDAEATSIWSYKGDAAKRSLPAWMRLLARAVDAPAISFSGDSAEIVKILDVRFAPGAPIGRLEVRRDVSSLLDEHIQATAKILSAWILSTALFLAIQFFVTTRTLRPLSRLRDDLKQEAAGVGLEFRDQITNDELHDVRSWFSELSNSWKLEKNRAVSQSRMAALGDIAGQVAHDIRSPLAALEVASADISQLPEDKRLLIRAAAGRIRDISNSLLERHRARSAGPLSAPEPVSAQLLTGLIDPVISEKRLQHDSNSRVSIELRLDASSYGLFAAVQAVEFKRQVSNLVGNAAEALENASGSVLVRMVPRDGAVALSVQDDGKGIPPEVLERLGRRGETHGKAGGTGLGLYHARACAESWGGRLDIASQVGKGTTVTVTLPLASAPDWFVPQLALRPGRAVMVLDDDPSIHQVWQSRLDALKAGALGVEVAHASSPQELRDWVRADAARAREALYLMDYELAGHAETGLSLAEELGIGERAILVTSRHEEPAVLEGCRRLKARLIPKGLAGLVPMRVEASAASSAGRERWDAVLIDDDALARATWELAAKRRGKRLRTFAAPGEFFAAAEGIDRGTPVYVDSELGEGVQGAEESRRVRELGFGQVYLATGHEPDRFSGLAHLRGVIGKEPPWA